MKFVYCVLVLEFSCPEMKLYLPMVLKSSAATSQPYSRTPECILLCALTLLLRLALDVAARLSKLDAILILPVQFKVIQFTAILHDSIA